MTKKLYEIVAVPKGMITRIDEAMKKIGSQKGSNEGGQYVDTDTNKQYYMKHYKNGDQAKVEALTGHIYNAMGIHTLNPNYSVHEGKPTITTEWNPHLSVHDAGHYSNVSKHQAHQIGAMYHAAILTKNWDIVGLTADNIAKHKDGNVYAMDHGGAFHFRAQGAAKDYGPDIGELQSLRNPSNASGKVFNAVFKQHPEMEHKSLGAVKDLDDDHVHHLFKNSGLHNWEHLHKNFMARKTALLKHYDKK
jgi:hypothetical protein